MKILRNDLVKTIQAFATQEGLNESPVPGVYCVRYTKTDQRSKRYWRACFGIVAQGGKEIVLGREVYRCSEEHYTASPIHLPVISRISSATPDKPFLAILIDLDPFLLSEVADQLQDEVSFGKALSARAFFKGIATERMLEAASRLTKLFHSPNDAPALGPLIIRELFYYLLKGPEGPAIRQFVRSESKTHKIAQAVYSLRADLSSEIDVSALAKSAGMSRSAFFQHFNDVTAMSPIQYQKRLRLLEAKRLMVSESETAEGAAFKVGYKSASQFSREYSRMFGNAPLRDVAKQKLKKPARVT